MSFLSKNVLHVFVSFIIFYLYRIAISFPFGCLVFAAFLKLIYYLFVYYLFIVYLLIHLFFKFANGS